MSVKKLLEKYSEEEIASSFVISRKLSPKQKAIADQQLAEGRKKVQQEMTEKQRLALNLLQLRFQIEDYLKSNKIEPDLNFGHFLGAYIALLNRKRKIFADEISISEAELSQFINNHRQPNVTIFIRLEIHSNNSIPAIIWYRLIEKERQFLLLTNKAIRKEQKKHVTNKVPVTV